MIDPTTPLGPVGGAVRPPAAATAAAEAPVDPKIAEAARELEGVFLSMLAEEMLKDTAVSEAGPVQAGLITQKLGEALADAGGFGLAADLERDIGAMR